jgi:hypothetical protein
MTKHRYTVCEANVRDEFPGCEQTGKVYQLEDTANPGDASIIIAWFLNESEAEYVARLLNTGRK